MNEDAGHEGTERAMARDEQAAPQRHEGTAPPPEAATHLPEAPARPSEAADRAYRESSHRSEASADEAGPDRFGDTGLPPHRLRRTDTDPRAARRAELQVAALFALSVLGTLIATTSYFLIGAENPSDALTHLDRVHGTTLGVGLGLFLALFGLGAGAVHWAKTLMSDEERVEQRHPQRGTDAERDEAVRILREGAAESGLGRRPLIRNTLLAAAAVLPVPAVVMLRDTGPLPGKDLATTYWAKDRHLVRDPEGGRVRATDLELGSVVHVMPEGVDTLPDATEERAKAAVLLIRLKPEELDEKARTGAYQGIVAYSKICTHMGCPVGLYEHTSHHLLCPCHQSTFDVTRNCSVIFGPAPRPLPQLPLAVDDSGYLVAADGFGESVGPSYWER